jgi:hypothetical protein
MKRVAILLWISIAACGGSGGPGRADNPPMTGDLGTSGTFAPFSPLTRGATYVDDGQGYKYSLGLMMTDGKGAIGCSLADPSANPGQAVSRVSFTLLGDAGDPAPTCGPQARAIGNNAVGLFERWDSNGRKTDTVKAIGGATSFASSSAGANLSRCDVMVTLTFPGGAVFTDSFSYNYDSYGVISPSCIQGDACSCQPWQTCNAQQKCVDLACVPSKATCPSDGSVPCCRGSCTGGVCCVAAGTQCDPSAHDCCYSCDFLNNQVYHGWYCTHP